MAGAFSDLLSGGGLGDTLSQQMNETEEERRKRLLGLQQNAQMNPVSSLYGIKRGLGAMSAALGAGGAGGQLR